MKAWQRMTHWRWCSSKWSTAKTPPQEGSAQAEEETTPPAKAAAAHMILFAGELGGILPRVGQVQPDGNGEEEKTKVDPSRQSYGPKESPGEDPVDERLLRKHEGLVRTGNEEEMIEGLHVSLLKLHDIPRRSEEMAAARLKAVEDEKAAFEVAKREEKAKTTMQEKTMHFLRRTNIQAQSVEMSCEIRWSGLALLVEKNLRKQVATLTQSLSQQAGEIRSLSTQLQGLEVNKVPLIGGLITVLSSQGASATFIPLGIAHPDCTRLRADFYPGLQPCDICLQGFKLGKTSTRFGPGVYFSKSATKASSYALGTEEKENGNKLRCISVADVAKGRAYITKKKGFDASRYPPVGHDSVQGEVRRGLIR
ncbi:unnamed protein product [Ectocarpus sp. CCAP 1310/34]|nr:unnamed protein product [Ectocarpus sp. CCAP 1310/34]